MAGKKDLTKYQTLEEAMKAVQNLDPIPRRVSQYLATYKQDPRLPSSAQIAYKELGWTGWEAFLGNSRGRSNLYKTVVEAKKALHKLVPIPETRASYVLTYKQDPRLPRCPDDSYSTKGWVSWREFLNTSNLMPYPTIKEAMEAVQRLKPIPLSQREYRAVYNQDSRLRVYPERTYKDKGYTCIEDFLGQKKKIENYESLDEAKKAVQRLKPVPKTYKEYTKVYKQDTRLPSTPDKTYQAIGWKGWEDYTGREKKVLYKSIEQAKIAVQSLEPVPTLRSKYMKLHSQDSKLPSCPDQVYEGLGWLDWNDFLGGHKEKPYENIEEARAAVQMLVPIPCTQKDYFKQYKTDPRLPATPQRLYREKGWTNWPEYLGRKFYTYIEAVKVLSEKKPNRLSDYLRLCSVDTKLPTEPRTHYSNEFFDWANFIGKEYENPIHTVRLLKEKGNNVSSVKEYLLLQEKYPSLPKNPLVSYGFKSFAEFLSFDKSKLWDADKVSAFCESNQIANNESYYEAAKKNPYLALEKSEIKGFVSAKRLFYRPSVFDVFDNISCVRWVDLAEKYIHSGRSLGKRVNVIKSFFKYYKDYFESTPEKLCNHENQLIDPSAWLEQSADSKRNESSIKILVDFFGFVLDECCSHRDEDSGEIIRLEGYRVPIKSRNLFVEYFEGEKRSESNKSALPFKYIEQARRFLVSGTIKTIGDLFERVSSRTSFYNKMGSDWFEVAFKIIDKADENCIWKELDGKYYLWSPIRLLAVYTQLFMPFRGSQICWLDSGEADQFKLVFGEGNYSWVSNEFFEEFRVPTKHWQGFLKPSEMGATKANTIAHVNTNKTATNAYQGYDIPWVDFRIVPWLIQLRDWQKKYNPIAKPIAWLEADLDKNSTKSQLKKYGYGGRSCFLFRDPVKDKVSPIKQHKVASALNGLLYLIQDEEFPLTYTKSGKAPRSLSNISTYFSLHSMRVSLITSFIRDGNIAPEIVQKLVGHSSIVMTIYYTKVSSEEMRKALIDAESNIIRNQSDRVTEAIRQRKMDEVKSELVDSYGELAQFSNDIPCAAISIMDYGLCPNGRTRCTDGGRLASPNAVHHLPVEPGYLGRSNCLQCRHFVSGPAFLGGIQTIANEISLECKLSAVRIEELRNEIDDLEELQYQAQLLGKKFEGGHKLNLTTSHSEQETMRFDQLSCDLISAIRFSMNSIQLLNRLSERASSDNASLLVARDSEIQISLSETSDFLHLDLICQSAEYYQCSSPDSAMYPRSQLLQLFAKKNGLDQNLFMLSKRQQLLVGNEITRLLRARLKGWDEVSRLVSKDSLLTLKDLGLDSKKNMTDLKFLFDGNSFKSLEAPKTEKLMVINDES